MKIIIMKNMQKKIISKQSLPKHIFTLKLKHPGKTQKKNEIASKLSSFDVKRMKKVAKRAEKHKNDPIYIEKSKFFDKMFKNLEKDPKNCIFSLEVPLINAILVHMEKNNISYSELARRMKVSKAWISRLLNEDVHNICTLTFTKIAHALGKRFELKVKLVDL